MWAPAASSADQLQGLRFAKVVRIRFEGQPQNGQRVSSYVPQRPDDARQELRHAVFVDADDGFEKIERTSEGLAGRGQRVRILGEARAAIAQPGAEKVAADAGIRAHALDHLGDVRAGGLAQVGDAVDERNRVARNELEACFTSSALRTSIRSMGRSRGAYNSTSFIAASWQEHPMTIRSGRRESLMAEPSRRNSGLEATSKRASGGACRAMMFRTRSPLPTGTVLFTTIRVVSVAGHRAASSAAAERWLRSA